MIHVRGGAGVEAADCASCNSSMEWHGRLPENPEDVICTDCHAERTTARATQAPGPAPGNASKGDGT